MSTTEATPVARPRIDFCSTFSERTGEETAGSAWAVRRHLLVEVSLPWPENFLESKKLPAALLAYMEQLWAKGDWDAIPGIIGIAPDEHYSIPGKKLVMHFKQPLPHLAGPYRGEAFAAEPDRFVELIQTVIDDPDSSRLDEFRVPLDPASRDLLVCTHGSVDICCATFGAPIYKLMRAMADQAKTPVRVWRATHFGGHRFAPTALDLPTGHYWGRLKPDILSGLIHRNKPAAIYRPLYRGSTSLQDPIWQRAEAELFVEAGWAWFDTTITSVSPGNARTGRRTRSIHLQPSYGRQRRSGDCPRACRHHTHPRLHRLT